MKWKLPFTSRYAKLNKKISSIESLLGKDEQNRCISILYSSFFGWSIPARNVCSRLDAIENKMENIIKYLNIKEVTTESKTFYRKVEKKTK